MGGWVDPEGRVVGEFGPWKKKCPPRESLSESMVWTCSQRGGGHPPPAQSCDPLRLSNPAGPLRSPPTLSLPSPRQCLPPAQLNLVQRQHNLGPGAPLAMRCALRPIVQWVDLAPDAAAARLQVTCHVEEVGDWVSAAVLVSPAAPLGRAPEPTQETSLSLLLTPAPGKLSCPGTRQGPPQETVGGPVPPNLSSQEVVGGGV